MNCDPAVYESKRIWLGGPIAVLVNRRTIQGFLDDYDRFKDIQQPNDVILTKMLTPNDYICKNPQLGYEKEQGGSVYESANETITADSFHVYIFNWKKVTDNVYELYKKVSQVYPNTFIINCDEHRTFPIEAHRQIQLDDSYYYGGQFETALKHLPKDKIFGVIVGDVEPDADWLTIKENSIRAFHHERIGIYAPNVYYTHYVSKGNHLWDSLYSVPNTDCTCWFINPKIVNRMRSIPYRDICNLGWGVDTIFMKETVNRGFYVARDYSVLVKQPRGTAYSETKARQNQKAIEEYYKEMKPELHVFVSGFWGGFNENKKSHEFWFFLLGKAFGAKIQFTNSIDKADILLESMFAHSVLNKKKWKYSIYFSDEPQPLPPNADEYTIILGWHERTNAVICPLYLLYEFELEPIAIPTTVPKKDVCVMISNVAGPRLKVIDQFVKAGIHIDFGGGYKNNIGGKVPSDKTLEFYSNYKFVLAFENSLINNYITEKIVNPMHAKSIPIYYGASNAGEYFNEERFIQITDETIEQTIQYVKRLLADEEQWLRIATKEPMVLSFEFEIEKIALQMRDLIYGFEPLHMNDKVTGTESVEIDLGQSLENIKIIDLEHTYSDEWHFQLNNHVFGDRFKICLSKDKLYVQRTDVDCGWGHNHKGVIVKKKKYFLPF
jgi:hypothetical protein